MISKIDAAIDVLSNKSITIWSNTNGSDKGKGDIEILFLRYVIKQYFFDRGYLIRYSGDHTFALYKQVNAKGKKEYENKHLH